MNFISEFLPGITVPEVIHFLTIADSWNRRHMLKGTSLQTRVWKQGGLVRGGRQRVSERELEAFSWRRPPTALPNGSELCHAAPFISKVPSSQAPSRRCGDGLAECSTLMSLTSSVSAQFQPPGKNRLSNSSTHSLATLNNNPPLPTGPNSLEPLRETTPLTNGGGRLKKVSVPVPESGRSRSKLPPPPPALPTYSSYPVSIFEQEEK
ncbi:unnamed protein product [Caenorhabditis auriculariae]|uniref:Uncharacterized protein n=1 Tax=Caenorhabditis auriculariae TaxID=2777116 RepID=A0A8S1H005_9PELO|nr:unnamed protein product [Caenorhabditis auriculariae]